VELLTIAVASVDSAIAEVREPGARQTSGFLAEPCGPPFSSKGTMTIDPLLRDRYQGLLVRSGVVAGSVHTVPSRLRERTEDRSASSSSGSREDAR